jgi:hypothetical protein
VVGPHRHFNSKFSLEWKSSATTLMLPHWQCLFLHMIPHSSKLKVYSETKSPSHTSTLRLKLNHV